MSGAIGFNPPVVVKCGCCRGSGYVPLADAYFATYKRLKRLGRELSGADLARDMGTNATAMNNRLVVLERHGLVTSRRFGRKRLFKAGAPHG